MKKHSFLAVFLTLSMVISIAFSPVSSVVQAAQSGFYGKYFHIQNDGSSRDNTAGFSGISDSVSDGSALYYQNNSKVMTDIPLAIGDITAPAGTKYFVFWFGQEYIENDSSHTINDENYIACPKFNLSYRAGDSAEGLLVAGSYKFSGGASGEHPVYMISTDDGAARSRTISGSAITGTPSAASSWGAFKNGYVVVPVSLISGYEDFAQGQTIDLRIRLTNINYYDKTGSQLVKTSLGGDYSGLSPNTRIYIDSVGFITDESDFISDLGTPLAEKVMERTVYSGTTAAYKMGYIGRSGELSASTSALETSVTVRWNSVSDASRYIVNVYNENKGLISTSSFTGNLGVLYGISDLSYKIQLLALDSAGGIISADSVRPICKAGDVNSDAKVDIVDLVRLKKMLAAQQYEYYLPADLDCDGILSSTDLVLMRKMLLGLFEAESVIGMEDYYNWNVLAGQGLKKQGDFDNTKGTDIPTPTPGENIGTTKLSPTASGNFRTSQLANKSTLSYFTEADSYAYGITDDGKEIIAFKDSGGRLVDATYGAGALLLKNTAGTTLINSSTISFFSESSTDDAKILTVKYAGNTAASHTAVYHFYDTHISVAVDVGYKGSSTVSAENSVLSRTFVNSYISCKKGVGCEWVYPDDGDYPYKYTESWNTVHTFAGNNRMYTFLRSDDIPTRYWNFYVRYPQRNIPMFFENSSSVKNTVKYDLVFVNDTHNKNADYIALFAGKGDPVAAGVEPTSENSENSSVFIGDSLSLNFNITNISGKDTTYSVRYDIRDYYGNIIDIGLYLNNTLAPLEQANRNINVSGKYGIYYMNYMVTTETSSYRECYPFILMPEHQYEYSDSSPFGINQILGGSNEPFEDYIDLAGKIGVAVTRGTALSKTDPTNSQKLIERAKANNIRMFGTGSGDKEYIEMMAGYGINMFNCGNELNLPAITGNFDSVFSAYVDDYFTPGYNNIKQQGYKYMIAAVAGGQSKWYDALYQNGLWDKFDVVALHPYGYPYSPDLYLSSLNIWHVEHSLKRNKQALDSYGYKETYVTETGYPTTPGFKNSVELRTQADYNMRCYILSLAYGVNAVMSYSFTDYSNGGVGTNANDNEWNFGAFYYPDYYGRILPKPWVAAFATMTRQLESVFEASINKTYDSGNTVRAFTLNTARDGEVIVAWSNCSRLPNDALSINRPDRKMVYPWQNQWEGSYDVTFKTDNSAISVTDTMGNTQILPAANGRVTVVLTGSPVIIKGAK